jgi:primosomal protein N' (replication factor Y)
VEFLTKANIAKIAVDNTAFHFDKTYDYRVPDELLESAKRGCRVTVSFGNTSKKRQGLIMELSPAAECGGRRLKPILSVLDKKPLLNDEMLSLVYWLKERTFCTLYEAVKAILPSGINHKIIEAFAAAPSQQRQGKELSDDEREIADYLAGRPGFVRGERILSRFGHAADSDILLKMTEKEVLERNYDAVRNVGDLQVKMIRLTPEFLSGELSPPKLTKKQNEVVELLCDLGSACVREVCYFTGFTQSVPLSLCSKGIAETYDNEAYRSPHGALPERLECEDVLLTDEQEAAFQSLYEQYKNGRGGASLLFGVTGSGKTNVYMKLADKVISDGRGIILMVPEISLTPQALDIFRARYGEKTAVFHSALSVGERLDEWKRVKNGEALMVVGTRSSVFAPFDNLGLIIIDEEQESTYKSENSPRYSARDVARFRCAKNDALLVLSSATPSVETYAAALKGRYTLNTLSERYGAAVLPEVKTVDMCAEQRCKNSSELSAALISDLKKNLEDGQQSILLINRRGYHTFASCTSCGHVLTCPSCSISMTYHQANGRMMCHYCGYTAPYSQVCPSCEKPAVKHSGFGTQKVEDDLARELPEARILRMDTDSTMSRRSHEEKLCSFSRRDYDILIGTQMVAKGLDFENVTLAAVVSVDRQLYSDDYRSLERTFALLTQVIGRSGRGKYKGRAIIQTMTPENEIIALAAKQDYNAFFKTEIEVRKALVYPPFCDICVVGFIGENELFVRSAAKESLERIILLSSEKYSGEKFIVLGPMPARVLKVNNKFRHRMIIKCRNSSGFRRMISELLCVMGGDSRFSGVTTYADMNPESII